jgi:hypothetical protein
MAGQINFSQEELEATIGAVDPILDKTFSEIMNDVRSRIVDMTDENELREQLILGFDNFVSNYNPAADAYDKVRENLVGTAEVFAYLQKASIGEVKKGSDFTVKSLDATVVTGSGQI